MNKESKLDLGDLICSFAFWIFASILVIYLLPRSCGTYAPAEGSEQYDSGTTQAISEHPSSRSPVAVAFDAPAVLPAAGGALFPDSSGAVRADQEVRVLDSGSRPTGFQLLDYEDSFLPTEEGLIDMTIGVWDNPDFLALTQDEAHELLALDDTAGFKGPDSMLSIAGPMPTIDDCRIGFRSRYVQQALQEVCLFEVLIVELGSIPSYRRDHWAAQRLQTAIRLRDDAALHLMEVLEEETAFGAWRLWWRLYVRWSR